MKQILHIPYCTGKMLQPNFDSTVCLRELSIVLLSHLTHSFNCCIIFLRMALLHFHNSGLLPQSPKSVTCELLLEVHNLHRVTFPITNTSGAVECIGAYG